MSTSSLTEVRRLAWSASTLSVLLTVASFVVASIDGGDFGDELALMLVAVGGVAALASMGALIASRTGNPLGWILLGIVASFSLSLLEALNNVAKYAQSTRATIRLEATDGELRFEVSDDGVGFDPDATGYSTGLQGMADRLDAIGGRLQVRSASGEGTRVVRHVPTPEWSSP